MNNASQWLYNIKMEVSKKSYVFSYVLNDISFLMKGKFIRSNSISASMRSRIHRYVAASHSGPFFSLDTTFDAFISQNKRKVCRCICSDYEPCLCNNAYFNTYMKNSYGMPEKIFITENLILKK
jgi:hypothetical protein